MSTLEMIQAAQERLRSFLHPTPLEPAPRLGADVWLKLENTNLTHSFKVRGALNAILALEPAERERGIVVASSGNHAQGIAYAARIAGVSARILMPVTTPQRKIDGVRRWGGTPELLGAHYDQTESLALQIAQDEGRVYISPYNNAQVVAGAGTIGLEIVQQMPQVASVIVCVSGGGLISGVALAIRGHQPTAQVIGVNARSAPAMYNYFYDEQLSETWHTLAEALSGDIETGSITIPIVRQHVSAIHLVDEKTIARAMRWLVDEQGWMIEGGGAVGVAAILGGIIAPQGPTVVVISGGNVDGQTLRQVLNDAESPYADNPV